MKETNIKEKLINISFKSNLGYERKDSHK